MAYPVTSRTGWVGRPARRGRFVDGRLFGRGSTVKRLLGWVGRPRRRGRFVEVGRVAVRQILRSISKHLAAFDA
jgi:hypothetical protein